MIREMHENDIPEMLILGHEMYASTSYNTTEWSMAKVSQLFISLLTEPNLQAWVAEKDGKIVGMFFGAIQEHFFGPTLKAIDLLLYVDPECRGGTYAYKLVKQYIDWAVKNGVRKDQIAVGVTTGPIGESAEKLYSRMGFERSGSLYRLGV